VTNEPLADRLARLTPQQRALLAQQLAARDKGVVRRADPRAPLPLAPAQLRMWFLEELQPGTGSYHVYNHYRLRGALDVDALERAVREIVRRHEMLRTSFHAEDGVPVQVVAENVELLIERVDLRGEADLDARAQRIVDDATFRPFDLARAPLMRVVLVTLRDDEHLLLLVLHHIIADAWSLDDVFGGELATLYNASAANEPSPLADVAVHFGDVVLWQQSAAQQARAQEHLRWWSDELRGLPDALDLPTDRPRPLAQSFRGARHRFALEKELLDALQELARRERVTLFMLLLAAFETLLHRWSGQDDFAVGTPVSTRTRPEMEPVLGLFINTVAIRASVAGDPTFRELLVRVRDRALDAFAHQDAPFERVVESLGLERSTSRSPVYQTMLVLWSGGNVARELAGITREWIEPEQRVSRFDMTLVAAAGDRGLDVLFDYATDLFDTRSIERFGRAFATLLRGIVRDPERRVSQLPLLDDAERAQVLRASRGETRTWPRTTLHQLFSEQAARTPEADAIVTPDRSVTYRELDMWSDAIASDVRGDIVAFHADRSADAIATLLGILKAGAAYLPIDPSTPAERRDWMLADAGAVLWNRDSDAPRQRRDANAAYLIYTSGSTGLPKGVLVEHASAVNLTLAFIELHGFAGHRVLVIPPLAFDASVGDVFPVLATGGALVLHPSPAQLGAAELAEFCSARGVTAIDAPAALWRRWSEEWVDIPALRMMMAGGESIPVEQVRRFARATRNRVRFFNHYGPTEATVCATLFATTDAADVQASELPIGLPIANVAAYVVDRNLEPVPDGVAGELCLGGAGVSRGYLGRREQTAERFVADPFSDVAGARMYRTGDVVRRQNDGTLLFLGRSDRQLKLRGFRIEPGEIEAAILAFGDIRGAFVTLREHRLVAYVVGSFDAAALRAFLQERLPEYMVPSAFVALDALPLTSNGKVDQRALPEPPVASDRAIVAPRNETEAALVDIWRALLRVDTIGVDDDFFELGGDSLKTMPLVVRIRERFGVSLPLASIFQSPTVARLAQLITGEAKLETISLESRIGEPIVAEPDALPATFAPPRHVLLTGATGFLGAFLLHELLRTTDADIVCLVRAKDDAEGRARIDKNLAAYGLRGDASRIRIVRGDLAQPRLGVDADTWERLARELDVIVHNGSTVSFVTPYEKLAAANVGGTREVLRLAGRARIKPVHFVSTLSAIDFAADVVSDRDPLPPGERVEGGYNQSKWVADRIAQDARAGGIPVSIHRPARVTGDSRTGAWNHADLFPSWIKACVQLGLIPESDAALNMTPVDFLAAAIVRLALDPNARNGTYHFFNNRTMPLARFADALRAKGFAIESVPYATWRRALVEAIGRGDDNALAPFIALFPEEDDSREPRFDTAHTDDTLAALGLVCPAADEALVSTYLDFFIARGFLPAPLAVIGGER